MSIIKYSTETTPPEWYMDVNDGNRLVHLESADCWCKPTLDYFNHEIGVTHYIHHEPS